MTSLERRCEFYMPSHCHCHSPHLRVGVSEEGGGGVSGDSKTRRQVDTSINGFESQWCNKDKLCFILSLLLIPPPPLPVPSPLGLQMRAENAFVIILLTYSYKQNAPEHGLSWLVTCVMCGRCSQTRGKKERGGSTAGTTA